VLLELIQDVYVRVPALVLHRNICICVPSLDPLLMFSLLLAAAHAIVFKLINMHSLINAHYHTFKVEEGAQFSVLHIKNYIQLC
jgi:hypothetical protein